MSPVTKEIFLNANVCMTLGWFLRQQGASSIPSEADQFRMQQGVEIGMAARSFFPDGRFAPPGEAVDAAIHTQELLADPTVLVIFEATFQIDGYIAKPDILKRNGSGWDAIEVKSNLEDNDQMDQLVDDLTYTVMVLERCGLAVAGASLMLISRSYRKGMPTSNLVVNVDQTTAVKERLKDFRPLWKAVHDGTASAVRPQPMLIPACKSCDFFPDRCIGTGVSHPVHSIPSLHKSKLAQLAVSGILEVEHLPANFPLTNLQQRMVDCVRSKQPFISKSLSRWLGKIEWPAHYLDFESMMTAVPLFPQVKPYEQIVTQYSIHHCSAPGMVISHHEYLASYDRDYQQELAERLLADLGTEGSIIVYSSFEATRIGVLADRFPDLAGKFEAIKKRLFDLLKVIRRGFYHHQFGGSYSIKRALPVLVPEMSYDGLEIGDGETASARFAKMVLERYSADEAKQVRADLLGYCKQDTLAMIRLHERLLAAKS